MQINPVVNTAARKEFGTVIFGSARRTLRRDDRTPIELFVAGVRDREAGLSRLKHYYAGKTQITDRSLEILGRMTSLEEVTLSACHFISDAGLVHLARLPRLRNVSVDATARVSRAGVAVFPASVQVDFWT